MGLYKVLIALHVLNKQSITLRRHLSSLKSMSFIAATLPLPATPVLIVPFPKELGTRFAVSTLMRCTYAAAPVVLKRWALECCWGGLLKVGGAGVAYRCF